MWLGILSTGLFILGAVAITLDSVDEDFGRFTLEQITFLRAAAIGGVLFIIAGSVMLSAGN